MKKYIMMNLTIFSIVDLTNYDFENETIDFDQNKEKTKQFKDLVSIIFKNYN